MTLLDDHLTPIDPKSLYAALGAASPAAVGAQLGRASLLVLLAQINEETGFKACHAFNLGNIKHVDGDGHDYVQFPCTEVVDGTTVWIHPPATGCQFRAYASLEAGCIDYLALLKKRFNLAWPAVLAGDPAQFCHLLKTQHYYTADEATYTANVVWLDKHLAAEIPDDAPVPAADVLVAVGSQPLTGTDDSPHDSELPETD